jgi:rhamnose transport system permease protein
VLGLFAIVILQNGLRLSAQPAELAGILTGALLTATILIDRLTIRSIAAASPTVSTEAVGLKVTNRQLAILIAVILAAALIVTGGNWLLVRSLRQEMRDMSPPRNDGTATPSRSPASDRGHAQGKG